MRTWPITLVLTGSIGMGKSTASALLRRMGVPVHDADAEVHKLFARGGRAVPGIARAFPAAVSDGAVDREVLGGIVFGDCDKLRELERIVHPLVRQASERFVRAARARGRPLVVLDIPLLFETGTGRRHDAAMVVSAPAFVQSARVLARPGVTRERLEAIRSRQVPDRVKRRKADFVIPTGLGRRMTLRRLGRVVTLMRGPRGAALRRRQRGRA
jgi:dephospho-CoA kinase